MSDPKTFPENHNPFALLMMFDEEIRNGLNFRFINTFCPLIACLVPFRKRSETLRMCVGFIFIFGAFVFFIARDSESKLSCLVRLVRT